MLALLIGIEAYEKGVEIGALKGSHYSIPKLKNWLIERYGYANRDIMIMEDSREVGTNLTPTYANILSEIDSMVASAQAGDHFFFAYSGHSGQVENRCNSEEDGKDEVIVSSDRRHLFDNELKARLVDPLPLGSSLVVVLGCHFASLFDIKRHRRSRVFTPRISKRHRKIKIHWNDQEHLIRSNMDPKSHLVEPLPLGSRLIAVLDIFHSGSLLDLKHPHPYNKFFTLATVLIADYRKLCLTTLNRNVRGVFKASKELPSNWVYKTSEGVFPHCDPSVFPATKPTDVLQDASFMHGLMRENVYTKKRDVYVRYHFKQSHLRFLHSFSDVRSRPGWILPAAGKILVNVTLTEDADTWRGQVEGSEECGIFFSSAVEPV